VLWACVGVGCAVLCGRAGVGESLVAWGWQASVNPKAETVEELQGRRKGLHLGMVKLAREDLALDLQSATDAFVVTSHPLASSPDLEGQPCGQPCSAQEREHTGARGDVFW
jgi:hypothetical protein